ncbi:hypothetical protein EON65_41200 [archaeon]|nr:MAG: hypothetical protein EON65_41200 [archaeon]
MMSGQHLQDQSLESASPSGVSSRTSFSNPRASFVHGKKLPALRASTTGTAAEFLINAISPTASLHQIMKEQKEAQHQQQHMAHRHLLSQKAEEAAEVDDKPKLKFAQIPFKVGIDKFP